MRSWVVAALSLLAMGAPCRAEDPGQVAPLPFEAPGVLLSFEGGNVADNLVNVLKTLQKNGVTVPVKQRTLDNGTTLCGLLMAGNFPPPCGSLLPAIQMLNPKANLNRLRPGDVFNVPDIPIYDYTASGQFAPYDHKQAARGDDILKYWKHLDPVTNPDGSHMIAFKAFQVFIPAKDDAAVTKLYEQLGPLSSSNLLIDPLIKAARPARVFSARPLATAELMSQACRDGKWNPVAYGDYVTGDPDAIEIVKASLPEARTKTPVWIVDGPLMPSPNLYPAYGPSPLPADWTWTCKWAPFSTALHHANHMASIIASQNDKFGFVGLAPNVVIKTAPWIQVGQDGVPAKVPLRDISLAKQIVANENSGIPLRVYLMASQYDDNSTTPLASPEQRFTTHLLSRTIFTNHPLLIAAAGQGDENNPPVDLTTKTPISPMNLGDLDNVVIVTACLDCGRTTARLMPNANYSSGDHKMVHIAAPGGHDIGGWVSSDSIGAANGTSQAAAFAAGVAASMISIYPNVFTQARLVKRRLQVTSWPLPPGDGAQPDPTKLAAGVIDPVLALLDPSKTWTKRGGRWQSGLVKSVSMNQQPMTDANKNTAWIRPETVLRLMKTDGRSNQFSVYTDRNLEGDGQVAEIRRTDGVFAPDKAALVMCDNSSINLVDVDDFIASIGGVGDGSCP